MKNHTFVMLRIKLDMMKNQVKLTYIYYETEFFDADTLRAFFFFFENKKKSLQTIKRSKAHFSRNSLTT